MMEVQQNPILVPIAVGASAVACTILTHALVVSVTVKFVRHEIRLGRAGAGFWIDFSFVALVTSVAFAAHLIEIALWAVLFLICGEFRAFGAAYYHSAVNYTTLGYGDVIMTSSWRLLRPLEAPNGMLMFGVSTDNFCCHPTLDSSQVRGSQELGSHTLALRDGNDTPAVPPYYARNTH